MINLKKLAIQTLAMSIQGAHAEHHASVLVNGAWLRSRGNEATAYVEVLAMAERYSK